MITEYLRDIAKRIERDPSDLAPMQKFGDCTDDFAEACQQSFDDGCERMVWMRIQGFGLCEKVEAQFERYCIVGRGDGNTVNRWVLDVLQWDTGAWCGAVRRDSPKPKIENEIFFDEG